MIDKLEFLLALARERHFGRAAEACGVTQPTLSAGLKSLEDALGTRLVDRGSRFGGFTPEGDRVLDWARRIVGDAKAMRQDLDGMKRGLAGHLRLAVIPTALPVVARLTVPFQARHPSVSFTVLSRPSADILRLIEDLEVDAGITYLDHDPLGSLRSVPLYDECYHLVAAEPPAGCQTVTWAEAGGMPLCLLTPDMQNRRIIDELLAEAGIAVRPTLETDSLIALLAHVRTGRWATIVPPAVAEGMVRSGELSSIPLTEPAAVHVVGLVVPRREPATHLVAALIAEAQRFDRPAGAEPSRSLR